MFSPFTGGLFSTYCYEPFGIQVGVFIFLLILWSLAWKGWALWLAARREEKTWFVVLLLLNTLGILDIIYIFAFAQESSPTIQKIKRHMKNEKD